MFMKEGRSMTERLVRLPLGCLPDTSDPVCRRLGVRHRRCPDREFKPNTQHQHRTHDTTDQRRVIFWWLGRNRRFGLLSCCCCCYCCCCCWLLLLLLAAAALSVSSVPCPESKTSCCARFAYNYQWFLQVMDRTWIPMFESRYKNKRFVAFESPLNMPHV